MTTYSSYKELMDNENKLRQELTDLMRKDLKPIYRAAKEIGISIGALDAFLHKKRSPAVETLFKIDDYITMRMKLITKSVSDLPERIKDAK